MQPIDKPWEQLRRAESYIEKMTTASSVEEYEEYWKEFLHNLERSWNKLTSHLKRSPKYQGWVERGKTEKLRRQDQLLSYLVNARGAEEHSVAEISKQQSGGIRINPVFGNSLKINKVGVINGQIYIDSDQPIKIDFIPDKVVLMSVENRGRTYDVPSEHIGNKLIKNDPVEIAKLGVAFYKTYFENAEVHFVK
ncbi:MAG: hypothetical protein ABNH16_03765 [Thalassolituus sp.]|jgi:hypothetical protein